MFTIKYNRFVDKNNICIINNNIYWTSFNLEWLSDRTPMWFVQGMTHGVSKTLNLLRIRTFFSKYSMSWPLSELLALPHGKTMNISGSEIFNERFSSTEMLPFIPVFDINYWKVEPFLLFELNIFKVGNFLSRF